MDDEKREIYDRHGEEGLKGGQAQYHNPFDIFAEMFGGNTRQGKQKVQPLQMKVEVSLEDLYNGKRFEAQYERTVVCSHCEGSGAENPNDLKQCTSCQGHGVKLMRHQIAPGYFQQVQIQCEVCNGKGQIIKNYCKKCRGQKLLKEKTPLVINIDKGMEDNHVFEFAGEGNQQPGMANGDLIIGTERKPHPVFERIGSNLYTTMTLTLQEALFGFSKNLTMLDGSSRAIKKTSVTQPNQTDVFPDWGMPEKGFRGKMFITFQVILPSTTKGIEAILKKATDHQDL